MTRLQQAAKIANWKLLQLKGAMHILHALNGFIPSAQHRLSIKGRLKAIEKEIAQAIKDSYQEYKENELRARAASSTVTAEQAKTKEGKGIYKELPF